MNVLYIGPYRQNDGWGYAAKSYFEALHHSGLNLTARPIFMNNSQDVDRSSLFCDAEKNVSEHYDVIIQNVLPHMMRRYEGSLNVGISYFESNNIQNTPWPQSINLMDQMWVTSNLEKSILTNSGVETQIEVIPISCYPNSYDAIVRFDDLASHRDEFKFYFIGEYIERKNIKTLITAFNLEFEPSENVRLVIKANKMGMSPPDLLRRLNGDIRDIKRGLGKFPNVEDYKQEIIICSRLTNEEMKGLHQECDCFVVPSFGEAFCIPAFDAMGYDNPVIVGSNSSLTDFIDEENGYIFKNYEIPAVAADRALPFLYNGSDTWWQPDQLSLQAQMRKAFEEAKRPQNKQILEQYSHQRIGQLINEKLSR